MEKIKEFETRNEMYLDVPKGGIGAEVGVCKGMNAINLWHITKPSKMYLCDSWRERHPNYCPIEDTELWEDDHRGLVTKLFESEVENNKVELVREWGGNFLHNLPDDSLDWVYLDACHDYKPVSIEVEVSLRKVKAGGLIMGHDYWTNCLNWKAGVIRVVNERIQNGDIKMTGITIEKFTSYMCEVL
jgi:hypothetical protein